MRMERKIWQALPEELLLLILGRLPVRFCVKLRTVCKRWNYVLCCRDSLQRMLDVNLSNPMRHMSRIPGFFVQRGLHTWAIEDGGSQVYEVALRSRADNTSNTNTRSVMDACNGLIFCRYASCENEDVVSSIENPASRTSMRLPLSPHIRRVLTLKPDLWLFHAMAVDASTRRATVVVGRNNFTLIGKDIMNMIEMEIYDTNSNAWSSFSMTVPRHIIPNSRGIYSGGKFYWLLSDADPMAAGWVYSESEGKFHWPYDVYNANSPSASKCMVAFTVADRVWQEIPLPKEGTWETTGSAEDEYARLSGCDGGVVLICQKYDRNVSLWKLNENATSHDEEEWWCEVRAQVAHANTSDSVRGFCNPHSLGLIAPPVSAAVTRGGWIILMDMYLRAIIFNDDGKLVRRLTLPKPLAPVLCYGYNTIDILIFPFESNSMWWPK